ncbi:uncharacterized protein LOC133378083 [Rhineura floridana]|uniref:uncharacterized protein LOC133378083 n=1 Tax=Rhineura floridana TaxID=261503 RepID=UPI002AC814C6|nr:uncharacterized protein LOC133378083 [Rhineura floridana]
MAPLGVTAPGLGTTGLGDVEQKISQQDFGADLDIDTCSSFLSSKASLKANLTASGPQLNDEFPRETFTFNCPLPGNVEDFNIKLFKGQHEGVVCALYVDKGKVQSHKSESCDPVHSGDKVSFVLKKLKNKDSDTYICCLEVLMPVYRCCETTEKHLYVQEESCLLSEFTSWILVGLTVLSVVACIFCLIACCLKNVICHHSSSPHDYNNEYMPMAAVKPS